MVAPVGDGGGTMHRAAAPWPLLRRGGPRATTILSWWCLALRGRRRTVNSPKGVLGDGDRHNVRDGGEFVDGKNPNTFLIWIELYLVKVWKKSRRGWIRFRNWNRTQTRVNQVRWVKAKTLSGIGSGSRIRSGPGRLTGLRLFLSSGWTVRPGLGSWAIWVSRVKLG
jgi:hypothetical protein